MALRLSLVLSLVLFAVSVRADADNGIIHPDKPDAVITTSESIDDHEGAYEDIDDHEGAYEDIHDHQGKAGDIHDHNQESGKLRDHHADSETLYDKVVESERLHGRGSLPETTTQRLEAARAKLRAARERHGQHPPPTAVPAAADPEAPASSAAVEQRWAHWTSRIDVARQRIGVAQAVADVWDESYAEMIQADYPRGDARQELLDSRERSKQRLAKEQAMLPRMIEEARKAGVPPGVLELH